MKKIILLVLTAFVSLSLTAVEPMFQYMDWRLVTCKVVKESKTHRGRSAIYLPELYQSEDYLSVQSEYVIMRMCA